MKQILSLFFLIIPSLVLCQSTKKVERRLSEVKNIEQAEELRKKHPKWEFEIIDNDLSIREGEVLVTNDETGTYSNKLITNSIEQEFRVSYIFLDGNAISLEEINTKRTTIINEYNSGIAFDQLSQQYTMDNNLNNGDTGWFSSGIMAKEFEDAVKNHEQGEIFTAEIPSYHAYYVILKTHQDKKFKTFKLVKIKSR